jgi:pyruvate/2-oxoglutarate dehydrogenase complex dihydrolipoamide acyltransferase (E2) component
MEKAQEAVAELKDEVGVDLIDLRSIVPWDKATIEASVRKTGRLVIVQEDSENCSVGQMIVTHLLGQPDLWAGMKAPPVLVSKGHVMIGYNPIYEYAALPDVPRILDAIWRTVSVSAARGEARTSSVAPMPVAAPAAPAADHSHGPQNTVLPGTSDIIVRVPIMGEGLRSARVVSLNKQPGDPVKHDDVLCEVETDKAVYPIEASFAGTFKAWKIRLDDTVLIGQDIALVTGDAASVAGLPVEGAAPAPVPAAAPSPAVTRPSTPTAAPSTGSGQATPSGPMKGNVRPPALHPAITKRLDAVVPANMLMDVRWTPLRLAREAAKQRDGKAAASPSAMMAWCVVRAQEKHPAFRCLVGRDGAILEQADFECGVAVALDDDRLATASIPAAGKLVWADFTAAYSRAVEETRAGKLIDVQAPVNITSLGAFGVESATPIVVPPAMATIFIGSAHERMVNAGGVIHPAEVVTLSLTFDHRVVNGAGAAAFLQEVKNQMEDFKLPA